MYEVAFTMKNEHATLQHEQQVGISKCFNTLQIKLQRNCAYAPNSPQVLTL